MAPARRDQDDKRTQIVNNFLDDRARVEELDRRFEAINRRLEDLDRRINARLDGYLAFPHPVAELIPRLLNESDLSPPRPPES